MTSNIETDRMLLGIDDICTKLSISRSSFERLRSGELKATVNQVVVLFPEPILTVGRSPLWHVDDLNEWINHYVSPREKETSKDTWSFELALSSADKIARSSLDGIITVVEKVRVALNLSVEIFSVIRPTVVATACHDLASDYTALALISAMARVRGGKLHLVIVADDEKKVEIVVE